MPFKSFGNWSALLCGESSRMIHSSWSCGKSWYATIRFKLLKKLTNMNDKLCTKCDLNNDISTSNLYYYEFKNNIDTLKQIHQAGYSNKLLKELNKQLNLLSYNKKS